MPRKITANTNPSYDLIVIGGGPSGLMMAGRAAECGAKALLLEKNRELGKKLKITGGGRCNITNAEFDNRTFLSHFPEAKEFLYSPFSKFNAADTISFFEERGLPIVIEARKRAFPQTQKAFDVFRVMEQYAKQNGVQVRLQTEVAKFVRDNNGITGLLTTDGNTYQAQYYALATGGVAAPETGSTGDGFRFLEKMGHTIHKPNPNIVPLTTKERWVHNLAGTSLSFMKIRFVQNDTIVLRKTGKILFTHFGLSGPLILNSAYEVKKLLRRGSVYAVIDLFPDTELGDLDRRLWRLFEKHKNKLVKNVLPELLPAKLAAEIINFHGLQLARREVNSVTREERKKLTYLLKNLSCTVTGTLGFDKAVIADGGVALEEVDFSNMTSRLYPNLYLLGDVLNINRPSGGYSLQLCWTTGWVAGSDVAFTN